MAQSGAQTSSDVQSAIQEAVDDGLLSDSEPAYESDGEYWISCQTAYLTVLCLAVLP